MEGWGCIPKMCGGDDYITIPPIRLVNWTADKTSMRSFKKTTRHVCIFYFSSVNYQFYIHFLNKYQLGGSSTRPLSSQDPTGWLPSPLRQSIPPKLPSCWRHWLSPDRQTERQVRSTPWFYRSSTFLATLTSSVRSSVITLSSILSHGNLVTCPKYRNFRDPVARSPFQPPCRFARCWSSALSMEFSATYGCACSWKPGCSSLLVYSVPKLHAYIVDKTKAFSSRSHKPCWYIVQLNSFIVVENMTLYTFWNSTLYYTFCFATVCSFVINLHVHVTLKNINENLPHRRERVRTFAFLVPWSVP